MTELWFDWPEPTLPDLEDPGEDYTLGVGFTVGGLVPCSGVRWRVPDTAPSGTCSAAAWRVSDETLLAFKDFTVDAEDAGGPLNVYFDAEDVPTLLAATNYRASIYTPNRYCASPNYGWPEIEDILTAAEANGWLATAPQYPSIQSGNAANYHVSPIIEVTADPLGSGARIASTAPRGRSAASTPGRIISTTPRGRL